MLNRRYPESTALETYRLHEFTSFLQISGQLPENAIVELIEGSAEGDQESNTNESDHSYRKIFSLNPSQWKEVDTFYKRIEPEYQNIHSGMKQRKKKQKDFQGLLYIDLNSYSTSNPVVLLKDLGRPLIHAVDEAEPDKLWILNYRH